MAPQSGDYSASQVGAIPGTNYIEAGATDAALRAALASASAGDVVLLDPNIIYPVLSPLDVPDGVGFGVAGPMRSFGIPTGNYGDGGLPLTGAIIQPTSAFSGSYVIGLGDAPTSQAGGQYLKGITLDLSLLPSSSDVDGFYAKGWVAGVTMRDCLAWSDGKSTGIGLHVAADGSGHAPDFWDVAHCKFSYFKTGVLLAGLSDSYFLNVESTGNTADNWDIANGGNTRFVACKGETSGSGYGWNFTGNFGSGTVTLVGCSSESNSTGGISISGSGGGTYKLIGCTFAETINPVSGSNAVVTDTPNIPLPSDQGLVAWPYDPTSVISSTPPSKGQVHLVAVQVRAATTITNIVIPVISAGSGLTTGENFAGLYDAAGTLLSGSADITTQMESTGTVVVALTTAQAVSPGTYYAAFLFNGTTVPSLPRVGNAPFLGNVNQSAPYRFGSTGSSDTSLPSSFTPSSMASDSESWWVGVS